MAAKITIDIEQCPQLLGTLYLVIGGHRDGNSER